MTRRGPSQACPQNGYLTGRRNRALCLGILMAFASSSAHAQRVEIKPTGRLHLDYAAHDGDAQPLDDDFLVRRARLGIDGKVGKDWSFEIGYDFAGEGSFTDVSFTYEGWKAGAITVGQFKVPFGLEELTSSNNITFIERALPIAAFPPGRRLGAGFSRDAKNFTIAAMAFGKSIAGDEGKGVGARFTFTPINKGETVLHLGLAATTENPKTDEAKFNPPPESRPADVRFVNTGDLNDVRRINQFGLEAAGKRGPLSFQMEWMRSAVSRDSGRSDVHFEGWYVLGSWVITGESREYKDGTFRGVTSKRKIGAWELAARYSRIDLDDGPVQGGKEANVTLGLNWYANDHLRLMANFIKVRSERRGESDDPSILLLRTQIAF